jgi:uncharacterized protein (DUF1684 family)
MLNKRERTNFVAGLYGSIISANHKWTDREKIDVDLAIKRAAHLMPEFTTDDVWRILGPLFPVSKGMASRLNLAVNRGIITNTGRISYANRGGDHDHAQRLTIWAAV